MLSSNIQASELAGHLYALRIGEDDHARDELSIMADLIQKYSHFSQHKSLAIRVSRENIS
jgi:hypothetical protein